MSYIIEGDRWTESVDYRPLYDVQLLDPKTDFILNPASVSRGRRQPSQIEALLVFKSSTGKDVFLSNLFGGGNLKEFLQRDDHSFSGYIDDYRPNFFDQQSSSLVISAEDLASLFSVEKDSAYYSLATPTSLRDQGLINVGINSIDNRKFVKDSVRSQLERPRLALGREQSPPKATQGQVITAIIDEGIGFLHERFRGPEGKTRIASIALQSAVLRNSSSGLSPLVLTASDIDRLIDMSKQELLGERAVYRQLDDEYHGRGELALGLNKTHGTSMLDLAAGWNINGNTKQNYSESNPIIAVDLPRELIRQTNGALMDAQLVASLDFIRRQALAMQPEDFVAGVDIPTVPVVVNISLGTYANRHLGTSELERCMNEIIDDELNPIAAIVLPAGNSLQTATHAEVRIAEVLESGDNGETVVWKIKDNNQRPTFVQCWIPVDERGNALVDVELIPESSIGLRLSNRRIGGVNEATVWEWLDGDDRVKVRVSLASDTAVSKTLGARPYEALLTVAIAPSSDVSGLEYGVAPSGKWKMKFTPNSAAVIGNSVEDDLLVNLWIERGDSDIAFATQIKQTYFYDAIYEGSSEDASGGLQQVDEPGIDTPIKRRNTLNAYAGGENVIVVGSYDATSLCVSDFSSSGDGSGCQRGNPTYACVGEIKRGGIETVSTFSKLASHRTFKGTSVSAALVTRTLVQAILDNDVSSQNNKVAKDALAKTNHFLSTSKKSKLGVSGSILTVERVGLGLIRAEI